MMICSNCLFFSDGFCHRYPPQSVTHGPGMFPRVYDTSFCGEFKSVKKTSVTASGELVTENKKTNGRKK